MAQIGAYLVGLLLCALTMTSVPAAGAPATAVSRRSMQAIADASWCPATCTVKNGNFSSTSWPRLRWTAKPSTWKVPGWKTRAAFVDNSPNVDLAYPFTATGSDSSVDLLGNWGLGPAPGGLCWERCAGVAACEAEPANRVACWRPVGWGYAMASQALPAEGTGRSSSSDLITKVIVTSPDEVLSFRWIYRDFTPPGSWASLNDFRVLLVEVPTGTTLYDAERLLDGSEGDLVDAPDVLNLGDVADYNTGRVADVNTITWTTTNFPLRKYVGKTLLLVFRVSFNARTEWTGRYTDIFIDDVRVCTPPPPVPSACPADRPPNAAFNSTAGALSWAANPALWRVPGWKVRAFYRTLVGGPLGTKLRSDDIDLSFPGPSPSDTVRPSGGPWGSWAQGPAPGAACWQRCGGNATCEALAGNAGICWRPSEPHAVATSTYHAGSDLVALFTVTSASDQLAFDFIVRNYGPSGGDGYHQAEVLLYETTADATLAGAEEYLDAGGKLLAAALDGRTAEQYNVANADPSTIAWRTYTYPLSRFVGKTVYLVFRRVQYLTATYDFFVKDVKVYRCGTARKPKA